MSGMFGEKRQHAAHKSVEWYTPAWIFEALAIDFDLDPSSPHDMETVVPAKTKYTVFDDGLKKPWFGRVWLNPPYCALTEQWMRRMIDHRNGIALVFSRTDTKWFQEAMQSASSILFLAGRIDFIPGHENAHKKSRSGAGSALFSFGSDCASALQRLSDRGVFIRNDHRRAD